MSDPPVLASIKLVLPLPPSINSQYIAVGRKRVLSKGAQAFHKEVGRVIERARIDGSIDLETERILRESLLGVYLTFYFATPMRRDLDGGLKIALDAVCKCLGIDDRTVVDLHLTKQIDPLNPHLEMEMETITTWSFSRDYVYLGESTNCELGEELSARTIADNERTASPQPASEEPAT